MGKTACGNCAQRWCLVVSIKGCRHHKKCQGLIHSIRCLMHSCKGRQGRLKEKATAPAEA